MGRGDLPAALSAPGLVRALGAALIVGLAAGPGAPGALAQDGVRAEPAPDRNAEQLRAQAERAQLEALHLANLRIEQEDAFFRAWDRASAAEREAVAALIEELQPDAGPDTAGPLWGTLAVATAVLGGAESDALLSEEPAAVLALQALALDLRAQPGVFPVNDADDPEARISVHVAPTFALSAARSATARLLWVAPDGTERVAREEFVESPFFLGDGFFMYVRAPRSAPGLWSLVLELDDGVRPAVRSAAVPVPCVANLTPGFAPADVLRTSGLRVLGGLDRTAREWITAWALGQTLAAPVTERRKGALVLAATDGVWPAPLFAGIRGARWRAAFRESAFDPEFYGALPGGQVELDGSFEPSADSVGAVLGRLPKGAGDVAPRVLVLRGSAVLGYQLERLQAAAVPGSGELDALVVVVREWRPTVNLPQVPTLVLTPDPATRDALRKLALPHVHVELLERSMFLSELELPGRVAAFVERHVLAPRDGEDG